MKSILSRQEFVDVIAHLALALKVQPRPLPGEWSCVRHFARLD
jgi:hypothetical protein